jgi:hypothetical protein
MKRFLTLFTMLAVLTLCYSPPDLFSGDIDPDLLPSMIGASNSGNLFYLTFHPTLEEAKHTGNGIRIFVSSIYATKVTLEIKDLEILIQKTTIPNEVIEFFLTPSEAQMYLKDYEAPKPEQIWEGRAIKISSDDPIICYGVARFQATSDGYMALPVSSLGTRYIVASSPNSFSGDDYELSSFTSIVGAFDDTKVTFRMGGSGTCKALKQDGSYLSANQTIRRTLNEGDVWLIPGIDKDSELTGSSVLATKPIAVFSGNQCGQIPIDKRACDYLIEQELPMENWGQTYLVSPILGRRNYSIVKIFNSNYNTVVSIDGVPTYTIQNQGGIKGEAFIEVRANILEQGETKVKPVVISADRPINVVQFNPCANDDEAIENDPFQMQVLPIEQFQDDAIFNTPGIRGQYGFKTNYVNLVYKATTEGKIPDDLMWSEVSGGNFNWVKLSSLSDDPGMKFQYDDSDGRNYYSKTIKLTNDGVYRIKANDPFAAYAYGSDWYDSYGYPVAGCNYDLGYDENKAPIVNWEMDDDGFVVGNAIDLEGKSGKIKNDIDEIQSYEASGLSVVSMINALSSNYKFTANNFIPGTLQPVIFNLEPIDQLLPSKAVLAVSDRRGNDTILLLSFTPNSFPSLAAENTEFDLVKSNQETSLQFTLENLNTKETKLIKSIILENADPKFSVINNIDENSSLKVGEKHSFNISFRGADFNTNDINEVEGIFKNQIGFELSNGKKYYLKEISGIVYNPRIDMNDVNFATKLIGEDFQDEFITINNIGNNNLDIYGFELSDDSPFKLDLPEASLENPFVVKSYSEYKIKVEFSPDLPGEFNATLKVLSDGYVIKDEANLYAKAMPSSVKDDELISDNVNVRYDNGAFLFTSGTDYQLNSVEVYDLSGRLLHSSSSRVILNNYSLRLVGLSSGVYVLQMNVNNSIISKKVVI